MIWVKELILFYGKNKIYQEIEFKLIIKNFVKIDEKIIMIDLFSSVLK